MGKFNLVRDAVKGRQLKGFAESRAAQQKLTEIMGHTPQQAWSALSDAERQSYGSASNFKFNGWTRDQAYSMLSDSERGALGNRPSIKGRKYTPRAKAIPTGGPTVSPEAVVGDNRLGVNHPMLDYIHRSASGGFADKKMGDRMKEFGHQVVGNSQVAAEQGGFSSVWSMAGHHAIRGAVGGAVIGGATSALNGGDFWDGAKAGAFKGATIYGGLRMGAAATGAENWMNPLAGKGKGMLSSAYNMHALTGGKNVNISKSAAKILAQRQGDGLARGIMNMNS